MIDTHTSDRKVDRSSPTGRPIMMEMLQALRSAGDDMTAQQLLTMLFVSSQGTQSVSALAESLRLHEATLAVLYPPLVARGSRDRDLGSFESRRGRDHVVDRRPPFRR